MMYQLDIEKMYKDSNLPHISKALMQECRLVFMVQNILRVYRRLLIELIEDVKQFYIGSCYTGRGIQEQKKEGLIGINNCLKWLKSTSEDDLKPIYWNKYTSKAAKKHGLDVFKNGVLKSKGSDGSSALERIQKYGFPFYGGAENISIGVSDPFEVVINLIIDDGVKH